MIQLIQPFPTPLNRLHDWREGDCVVAVDDQPIEDMLDLYYYMPRGTTMTLKITRMDLTTTEVVLEPYALDQVMSCFAAMEFKTCACDCVFCFVDQNPEKMRSSIYVKDEDYRLSFLYGNYITLTSMGRRGIERIIDQKMSPLYVSVHATDIDVRTRMLGIKRRIDVMEILQQLTAGGIAVQSQIVICPGWNDGEILDRSIRDLSSLYPGVETLAVVPVGLSAHRKGLTQLDSVTPEIANQVIDMVHDWQVRLQKDLDETFVHLSDEFYLLTDRPFPPLSQYGEFAQVDSGIGVTALLGDMWSEDLDTARDQGTLPTQPITILTGPLGKLAFEQRLSHVLRQPGLPEVDFIEVENHFYGDSVTVAGLLSGQDIQRAIAGLSAEPARHLLLPPRMFNSDGVTLDDMRLEDLAEGTSHRLHIPDEEGLVDFWQTIG
jgi:putative radical SAM enzyme (TIGR03279 family)